jgi:esterase/lipase superfamily enzyme
MRRASWTAGMRSGVALACAAYHGPCASAPAPAPATIARASMWVAMRADEARLAAEPPPPSAGTALPAAVPEYVSVPVYYASTRGVVGQQDAPEQYYGVSEDTVKYGIAYVSIPARRRPGQDDGRGFCRYLPGSLKCTKTPANSVMITNLELTTSGEWLTRIGTAVDSGGAPADVLIFVHGFNNSFSDAVHRAAQVAYDAGFTGVTATFDWASRSALAKYTIDQETAERSVPDFEQFLQRLADSTNARRIAIVAHSMGTRLVSYALRDMARSTRTPKMLYQIVFAASDIDSAIFVRQFAHTVASSTDLLTLYASSRDVAITTSKNLVHDAPRVGSGPPSVVLVPGVDYVDASTMDTDLIGHGYFAENKQLIDDIFLVLKYGMHASMRNLATQRVGEGVFYRLK